MGGSKAKLGRAISSSDEFRSDEGDPLYDSQDDENLSRQEDEVEAMKYD